MGKITTTRLIAIIAAKTGQRMSEIEKTLGGLTEAMIEGLASGQEITFTEVFTVVPEPRPAKTVWKFGKLHEMQERMHFKIVKSRTFDSKYRNILHPKNKYLF